MKTPEATFVTPSARSCDQTSTAIVTGWKYPSEGSGIGEMLSLFLLGYTLTPLDSLRMAGVMRPAAVVHALRQQGWPIVSNDTEVVCSDGHTAIVAAYSLPNDAITEAMQDGAAAWCESVKEARALKRAKAARGLQ